MMSDIKKSLLFFTSALLTVSLLTSCVALPQNPNADKGKDEIMTNSDTYLKKSDLSPLMQNIFDGDEVFEETVMFIDRGQTRKLLFPIEKIIAVTPYSSTDAVYEEGRDYTVVDGKLHIPESSRINCITSEKFYNTDSDMLKTEYNGEEVNTLFAEGRGITDYQIRVTYRHSGAWEGYRESCSRDVYSRLIDKLKGGEDITLIFYGDSITWGAASSYSYGYPPYAKPFSLLFTEALADLFGYTVSYIDYSKTLSGTPTPPSEDYNAGTNGTITYINTSVGGRSSADGCKNAEKYLEEPIKEYGCDLLVLGFGMNDGYPSPNFTKDNLTVITEAALGLENDISVMLISTMIPNPDATNGWSAGQEKQADRLLELAEEYRERGIPCATVNMTQTSISVYEKKEFIDCTGNNINHPNDFMMRIYAISMIQSLLGYENIK